MECGLEYSGRDNLKVISVLAVRILSLPAEPIAFVCAAIFSVLRSIYYYVNISIGAYMCFGLALGIAFVLFLPYMLKDKSEEKTLQKEHTARMDAIIFVRMAFLL